MFSRIAFILGWLRRLATSRSNLLIENLALRRQLAILTAKRPRPKMRAAYRIFWVALRRFWPRWKEALVVIQPDTVVRWHHEGFRKFWTRKSRRRFIGRPSTQSEIHHLVRRMAAENPTSGAPRIHGEMLMLGCDVSERTVYCSAPPSLFLGKRRLRGFRSGRPSSKTRRRRSSRWSPTGRRRSSRDAR